MRNFHRHVGLPLRKDPNGVFFFPIFFQFSFLKVLFYPWFSPEKIIGFLKFHGNPISFLGWTPLGGLEKKFAPVRILIWNTPNFQSFPHGWGGVGARDVYLLGGLYPLGFNLLGKKKFFLSNRTYPPKRKRKNFCPPFFGIEKFLIWLGGGGLNREKPLLEKK